ncbi:MAG: CPBP family intramembrane glutamic endopeptidase [Chloroflexota bacterium]
MSLWFFTLPAVLFVLSMYILLPYLRTLGLSEYMSYCWALISVLVLMLVAAVIAYRIEGQPLTWAALAERFRLRAMTRQDWLWTGGLFLFMLVSYSVMLGAGRWLIARNWIPLPSYIPAMIDPRQSMSVDAMKGLLGGQVHGQWSLVIVTLLLLFFNIVGEEFWWRGYILPRQELAMGKYTWLVHGVLWTLFHGFKYWDWLALLPLCLGIAFVAQRRQNTWPGFITHLLLNGASALGIILLVITGGPP